MGTEMRYLLKTLEKFAEKHSDILLSVGQLKELIEVSLEQMDADEQRMEEFFDPDRH